MSVTLCVLLWANEGCADALVAYEDQVLELLGDYGATVVQRTRMSGAEGGPDEMQLLWLPSQAALDGYMADPRRTALADVRDRAIARTEVLPVDQPISVGPVSVGSQPSIRPQPLISVADVERSSAWYQRVLGATSDHGGPEYERLVVDGQLVLQLHRNEIEHHHGTIGDPTKPVGNGVAVWFEADEFDDVVERIRRAGANVETDVHLNPNAGHREIWIRDLDGYLVVIAEAQDHGESVGIGVMAES